MTDSASSIWQTKVRWRYLFLIAAILAVGKVTWSVTSSLYLESKGFCEAQERYLTDEELILRALNREKSEILLKDGETLESYWRNHPECCSISRPASLSEILFEHWFTYVSTVTLYYERIHPIGNHKYIMQQGNIDACGRLGKFRSYSKASLGSAKDRFTYQ